MDRELEANRARWDELVDVHASAAGFYDLDAFRAGRDTLDELILGEVGDVRGKRLLHLQCHFGMDTISWARHGAEVLGVDFSPKAISLARALSDELGVDAAFLCSDVYSLGEHRAGEFDVVFTSYGVLCWLPDLIAWAEIIDRHLAPGGVFYVADQHPIVDTIMERDGRLVLAGDYFGTDPVVEHTRKGSYADPDAVLQHNTTYEWRHTLAEIVNALTARGLHIEFMHEFPFCMFQRYPSMIRDPAGEGRRWWRMPNNPGVPLLFSLRVSKPLA